MRQRIYAFGWAALFWLGFFVTSRIVFLLYNHDMSAQLSALDIATLLVLGLRMDAAMTGYWLVLTGLTLTAHIAVRGRWLKSAMWYQTLFLLLISCVIVTGDLELYRNWGFRMDTTPLMYVGSEGAGSIQWWVLIKLLCIFTLLLVGFAFVYFRWLLPKFKNLEVVVRKQALTMFLVTGVLFFPIRSSISVAPLNTGVVYFHNTIAFANHAGINVVWNFFKSLTTYNSFRYPSNLMDASEAEALLKEMTATTTPTQKMVSEKPNILLIILESFTAKVVEPFGGQAGITPNLNRLANENVAFTNFYASGDRTDKGIVSILSGYPAQPKTSIIKFPDKTQKLPFLPRSLQALGYHTTFVYGGDIGFANMESYVTNAGFSHITEDDDFPSSQNESKWGVHDHIVFERLLQECDTAAGPFFKVMLSLSSHEPFDVPLDPPFMKGADEASLFLNSCFYTDKSLGAFIAAAEKKEWWKNTWVVITADHGHRYPDAQELKEKERFKIPMVWLGGAVTAKDTVVNLLAGQTDIANTVLAQVNEASPAFTFSKNIVGNPKPYAIYIFQNGYGYVDNESEDIYDFDLGGFIKRAGNEQSTKQGKAYVQSLFSDYNKR